jgi:hypothetical protein
MPLEIIRRHNSSSSEELNTSFIERMACVGLSSGVMVWKTLEVAVLISNGEYTSLNSNEKIQPHFFPKIRSNKGRYQISHWLITVY